MLYMSAEDFYEKVKTCQRLTREEEIACAKRMQKGDPEARERLIQSYLPMVAGYIKRLKPDMQTLKMVLYCVQALEKAVDSFNFLQESETFTHRLSWYLRQCLVKGIVK